VSNEAGGRLAFRFHARDVNLVMGPVVRDRAVRFRVLLDGETPDKAQGTDVDVDGRGALAAQATYQLVRQIGPVQERRFEIEFIDAAAEAYCLTFG
jgi:thioredoxin family protein